MADLGFITGADKKVDIDQIPFNTVDGINDAGVCIQVNVMPAGENGKLKHTEDTSDDLSGAKVTRLVLDYADSVKSALNLLKNRDIDSVFGESELHWMISGPAKAGSEEIKTVVVEVFPDGLHITEKFEGNKPIMTNFNISNFDGTPESIGTGMGYERWQILSEDFEQANSVMGTFDLMEKVFYSKTYDLYGDRFWYSEFSGVDLNDYYSTAMLRSFIGEKEYNLKMAVSNGIFYGPDLWNGEKAINGDVNRAGVLKPVVQKAYESYTKQEQNGDLWITIETAVYDIKNRTLDLAVRESQDHYHFEIGGSEYNGKSVIGSYSDIDWDAFSTDVSNVDGNIIENFTMYITMPGKAIKGENDIQAIIAEKTGVSVKETWLPNNKSAWEVVPELLASGRLPDYIESDENITLYQAGVLVPWDDYLEKYPRIKEFLTEKEWDMLRQQDGHIYWLNPFGNTQGKDRYTIHNDAAFWIQVRVLEWANYPEIETLEDYFDLLEKYYAAHPSFTNAAGEEVEIIPYTALCDDWRYFCIESAPQFLAGYPNDGSCIVNTTDYDKPTVEDYNNSETAKRYFEKLNEAYNKGLIYKGFATQSYNDYMEMLSTGAVLGMFDQWWDFGYTLEPVFREKELDTAGCSYVPLGLTIDRGMENRYHIYEDTLNLASGIAVTTSCKNPDKAFQFINDLLDQEILNLRFWGVEGEDYLVDGNGLYYRTEDMRKNCEDDDYKASHMCQYSYFPQWSGTNYDGINAMKPEEQTSEFYATLPESVAKCLQAYGAGNYPDMVGSVNEPVGAWFPMNSTSYGMLVDTPGMHSWTLMGQTKHEWLPKVVMAQDFEKAWSEYMEAYDACNPQEFIKDMQAELDRRIELANR